MLDRAAMDIVHRVLMQGQTHPRPSGKGRFHPFELRGERVFVRREIGDEDRQTIRHAAQVRVIFLWTRDVLRCEQIAALGRSHAAKRDEFGQVAVAITVLGQQNQPEGGTFVGMNQLEIRPDEERQLLFLRLNVSADDACERTFIGDGETRVAELRRANDEFLPARRPMQEGEVGKGEKLRVRGQDRER
ncbi:hypothetical protein AWB81_08128 [Caballeronia arationis]|nr:hypothetical protein AWB81_08128 [Caballeronia arationis]